jgi:hypothetical protein
MAVRLHVLAATALVVMATMGGAKKAVGMFKGADVNGNSHSWRCAPLLFRQNAARKCGLQLLDST